MPVKTHQMCLLANLQKETYQKNGEHQELSQYVLETIHATFPITFTSAIVSQLLTGRKWRCY